MDVILFFQGTMRASWRRKLAGVHGFAQTRNWFVQVVERFASAAEIRRALKTWNPAGCLVDRAMSAGKAPDAVFRGVPAVYLDQDPRKPSPEHPCLLHDSGATAALAARELLSLGCRSYAYLGTGRALHWDRDRLERFRSEAAASGRNVAELGRNALAEEIRRLPKPLGILGANDSCAVEAYHAAALGGFSIPSDVAIVGIDNDPQFCETVSPGITSVEPDFEGAGRRLAQMLATEMEERGGREKEGRDRGAKKIGDRGRVEFYGPLKIVRRGSTDAGAERSLSVRKALEFIRRHACDESLGLDDVVAEMRCSRRLATLVFKRETGRTILGEIHERRLERLCGLLANTALPIATVVAQCGWRSDGFAKRLFRKRTGMTMREYRTVSAAPKPC